MAANGEPNTQDVRSGAGTAVESWHDLYRHIRDEM